MEQQVHVPSPLFSFHPSKERGPKSQKATQYAHQNHIRRQPPPRPRPYSPRKKAKHHDPCDDPKGNNMKRCLVCQQTMPISSLFVFHPCMCCLCHKCSAKALQLVPFGCISCHQSCNCVVPLRFETVILTSLTQDPDTYLTKRFGALHSDSNHALHNLHTLIHSSKDKKETITSNENQT